MTGPWEAFQALEARLEQRNARLDNWAVFTVVLAGIAVLLSVIAIGFGYRALDESRRNIRVVGPVTSSAVAAPKRAGATCPRCRANGQRQRPRSGGRHRIAPFVAGWRFLLQSHL
jgi:hypothetical protein